MTKPDVWIGICGSVYSAKQQEPHESAFSNKKKKTLCQINSSSHKAFQILGDVTVQEKFQELQPSSWVLDP